MGRNFNRQQNYTLNRGNGNDGVRKYDQHDDRSDGSSYRGGGGRGGEGRGGGGSHNKVWSRLGNRQVSFGDEGAGGGIRRGGIAKKGGRKYQSYNNKIHVVFPEGDEGMVDERHGDQAGRGRPLPRMGRGKYKGGVRGGPGRTPPGIVVRGHGNPQSFFSWQKVILKNGSKYDKIMLLKELLARANIKFIPICYTKQGMNTFFYLEDQAASKALRDLDKKIELPDGYPLQITIERSTPPNLPLTEELLTSIKTVMSDRYRAETKALNLKSFHTDEKFAGESFYAPLWRTNVLSKVMTVVVDNIPEVRAMDLSNNKLTNSSMEFFSSYKTKLNDLRILYLENNKIQEPRNLQKFKGMKLEELKLTGNPLVAALGSSYTEIIRKIFPSLKILDGKELPPVIGFEEDEASSSSDCPPAIAQFIKNPGAEDAVKQFLKAYIDIYDSDKRENLLQAYHDSATFSMSALGSREQLSAYIPESRNLLKVDYEKKRHDLLRRGKLGVVAFLEKLPKTEHDMTTFTLDVPYSTEAMMIFTVTGCFRERGTKQSGVRHFTRCFVVVPNGAGFNIINETLYVSQATDLSKRKPFVTENTTSPPTTSSTAVDEGTKQSLALSFSQKSGMNLQFSAQCLQENNWDFDKAAIVFSEANAKGLIPAEAFLNR